MKLFLIILLIVCLLFFILLLWVMIAPIVLTIDSVNQKLQLELVSIGKVNLIVSEKSLGVGLKLFFWEKVFPVNPFIKKNKNKTESHDKDSKSTKKKSKKRPQFFTIQKMKQVLRSFTLKKIQLNIDTDDYCRNGIWYPVFYFLSRRLRRKAKNKNNFYLNINYQGLNDIQLIIENRMINIVYALLF